MNSKPIIALLNVLFLFLSSCGTNEAVSPSDVESLKNGPWRLVAFVNQGQHGTVLQFADTIVAVLYYNELHGYSVGLCANSYSAIYSFGPYNTVHIDSIASTKAACPLSQYWDYVSALGNASAFVVDGSRLLIYYGAPGQAMAFDRMTLR